jgi:DNA-binding MarR family transcriptional regulator
MAEDFTQRLPYLMRMVSQVLSQQLERALRPHGLTHAQLAALAQLSLNPSSGTSGAELARGAVVTAQSMSTAIASLLERGLVVRTPHPTHGRVLEVAITAEGSEVLARAQIAAKAVEDRAVAQLSQKEHAELTTLMRKVVRTLGLQVTESALR